MRDSAGVRHDLATAVTRVPLRGARALLWVFVSVTFTAVPAAAQDTPGRAPVRIVEEVPALVAPQTARARPTPSGLPVPRYVSLKHTMNCRQGPSRAHAPLWRLNRKGLPLVVVAETELWRRVRDVNGDECWVLGSGLSGTRRAVVLEPSELRAKPSASAKARARAERGAILDLKGCREGWCEVEAETAGGRKRGWVRARALWGAQAL